MMEKEELYEQTGLILLFEEYFSRESSIEQQY